MNAISSIRTWCAANGYAFTYGNPMHVNEWMNGTDFSSSTDGTAVFCHLLTASDYDGSRDTYNVGVYFATLVDFDFDNNTIDATTEALKERAKTLLHALQSGNEVGWSGARFQYGYDDYAENVCWCCLRVTLTALESECVEMEMPDPYNVQLVDSTAGVELLTALGGTGIQSFCDTFVTSVIGDSSIFYSANIITDIEVAVDGTMLTIDNSSSKYVACRQIDQNLTAVIPSLSDYVGKWLVTADATLDGTGYTETATLSIPEIDVELSCEITW